MTCFVIIITSFVWETPRQRQKLHSYINQFKYQNMTSWCCSGAWWFCHHNFKTLQRICFCKRSLLVFSAEQNLPAFYKRTLLSSGIWVKILMTSLTLCICRDNPAWTGSGKNFQVKAENTFIIFYVLSVRASLIGREKQMKLVMI